jgi:alpha-tubulin suppressor-like RCC1 family protein
MSNEGEIGNSFGGGTTSAPVNITTTFAPASISSLSAGSITTTMCALANTGAAWCWGSNQGEKLGVPNAGSLSSFPIAVSGGHNFLTIANGTYHTCGVDNVNQVYCWGYNLDGRTGQPSATTTSPTPQFVSVAGETFTNVVAGNRHTCALTTGGRIYCWGSNLRAQLGNAAINAGSNIPSLVWGS